MTDIVNNTDDTIWIEGLQSGETGDPLVIDEIEGDVVYVRHADPGDDTTIRVPLDPGQRIVVAAPRAGISIHLTDDVDADDAIYWIRIVMDRREAGVVFARTIRPGEVDDGRRVHVRPGERLELPQGSVQLSIDEIEKFYRDLDPHRPRGSFAAVVRVWHVIRAIEPPELARIAQAAAHRLDSASYLLDIADPIGRELRGEDGPGGPAAVAAIDEYIHLVQEAAVALARCIALIGAGRKVNGFAVPASAAVDKHGPALKEIRDAYEHIDERALGKVKWLAVSDSLSIFDHSELVRTGTITYLHHRLNVDDLVGLTSECRTLVKALIGGPPAPT